MRVYRCKGVLPPRMPWFLSGYIGGYKARAKKYRQINTFLSENVFFCMVVFLSYK
jgi:hypothetical protein